MNINDLKKNLAHLIQRYVSDEQQKKALMNLVFAGESVAVKGIVADLTPCLNGCIDAADAELLKDIVFYYC